MRLFLNFLRCSVNTSIKSFIHPICLHACIWFFLRKRIIAAVRYCSQPCRVKSHVRTGCLWNFPQTSQFAFATCISYIYIFRIFIFMFWEHIDIYIYLKPIMIKHIWIYTPLIRVCLCRLRGRTNTNQTSTNSGSTPKLQESTRRKTKKSFTTEPVPRAQGMLSILVWQMWTWGMVRRMMVRLIRNWMKMMMMGATAPDPGHLVNNSLLLRPG